MRQSWTPDRLDDLSRTMVERFDRVEEDIERRFDEMGRRFDEMGGRVDRAERVAGETRDHLISLQRTMIQVAGGLIAGNLALLVGVIGVVVSRI